MENYGIVPQLQLSTIIPIYIILINIIGFFIMLIDKKKAENGKWRIQEKDNIYGNNIRRRNRDNFRNVHI